MSELGKPQRNLTAFSEVDLRQGVAADFSAFRHGGFYLGTSVSKTAFNRIWYWVRQAGSTLELHDLVSQILEPLRPEHVVSERARRGNVLQSDRTWQAHLSERLRVGERSILRFISDRSLKFRDAIADCVERANFPLNFERLKILAMLGSLSSRCLISLYLNLNRVPGHPRGAKRRSGTQQSRPCGLISVRPKFETAVCLPHLTRELAGAKRTRIGRAGPEMAGRDDGDHQRNCDKQFLAGPFHHETLPMRHLTRKRRAGRVHNLARTA